LLQHLGEIQLSATNTEAFKLLLEAAAKISYFGHLRFPEPHLALWLKSSWPGLCPQLQGIFLFLKTLAKCWHGYKECREYLKMENIGQVRIALEHVAQRGEPRRWGPGSFMLPTAMLSWPQHRWGLGVGGCSHPHSDWAQQI